MRGGRGCFPGRPGNRCCYSLRKSCQGVRWYCWAKRRSRVTLLQQVQEDAGDLQGVVIMCPVLLWWQERMSAKLSASFAKRGRCSQIAMPGTLVGIGRNSPFSFQGGVFPVNYRQRCLEAALSEKTFG
jgi:hypothetical protein